MRRRHTGCMHSQLYRWPYTTRRGPSRRSGRGITLRRWHRTPCVEQAGRLAPPGTAAKAGCSVCPHRFPLPAFVVKVRAPYTARFLRVIGNVHDSAAIWACCLSAFGSASDANLFLQPAQPRFVDNAPWPRAEVTVERSGGLPRYAAAYSEPWPAALQVHLLADRRPLEPARPPQRLRHPPACLLRRIIHRHRQRALRTGELHARETTSCNEPMARLNPQTTSGSEPVRSCHGNSRRCWQSGRQHPQPVSEANRFRTMVPPLDDVAEDGGTMNGGAGARRGDGRLRRAPFVRRHLAQAAGGGLFCTSRGLQNASADNSHREPPRLARRRKPTISTVGKRIFPSTVRRFRATGT